MRKSTHLKLCLLLPIIIPVILLLAGTEIGGILSLSLFVGGPVYLPFCIALLIWSREKTEAQIINAAWKAPIIFTATINILYLLIFLYQVIIQDTYEIGNAISGMILFSLVSLLLGYIYVGIAMLTMRVIFSKTKSSSNLV